MPVGSLSAHKWLPTWAHHYSGWSLFEGLFPTGFVCDNRVIDAHISVGFLRELYLLYRLRPTA